jgi:uncharacterized membrane protein YeaQ/YmgE (transglycosylase-associated protein family)
MSQNNWPTVAGKIVKGSGFGILINIVIGVVGGFVGGG